MDLGLLATLSYFIIKAIYLGTDPFKWGMRFMWIISTSAIVAINLYIQGKELGLYYIVPAVTFMVWL